MERYGEKRKKKIQLDLGGKITHTEKGRSVQSKVRSINTTNDYRVEPKYLSGTGILSENSRLLVNLRQIEEFGYSFVYVEAESVC